jgi:hypothetical protein
MTIRELAPLSQEHADVRHVVDDAFLARAPLAVYDDQSIAFLAALAARWMAEPEIRGAADLVALAYWLRSANLERLLADARSAPPATLRVPRGLALHIAPANVDTVFLYSFALSLLAGNSNVVRVSQRLAERLEPVLACLRSVLAEPRWSTIARRNRFVSYAHDEGINRYLSLHAHARVLWGGDATVAGFRALPARVDVVDLVFPDRFSYCAVASDAYLALDAARQRTLARAFYNDAYTFDQRACSSPSVVYFVGDPAAAHRASEQFWNELAAVLAERRPAVEPSNQMNHLVFAYEQLADGQVEQLGPLSAERPTVVRLSDPAARPPLCGGGLFLEAFLDDLSGLTPLVRDADQTLTHFGFDEPALRQLAVTLAGRGLSRLVPIGQALSFGPIWDGYDLLRELTKLVVLQVD